jgi:hypothetical protein
MDMTEQLERRGNGELKIVDALNEDLHFRSGTHYHGLFPPKGPDDSPSSVIVFESGDARTWSLWIVSGNNAEFIPIRTWPGMDPNLEIYWKLGERGLEPCEGLWTAFENDCHVAAGAHG